MTEDDEGPYIIALGHSDIGHLPDYGSRFGRTICHAPAVEAALTAALERHEPVYRPAAGRRLCRLCASRWDYRQARTAEQIAALTNGGQ